jgi:nicotinamide mononucleotide transporter
LSDTVNLYWLSVEVFSAVFNLLYLFGLISKRVWAWPMGALGCLLAAFLFSHQKLYLEGMLNLGYTALAIMGWLRWGRAEQTYPFISKASILGGFILLPLLTSLLFGWGFHLCTDNPNPYLDAFLFSFSVGATLLQIKKQRINWPFWWVLNALTTYVCISRGLYVYAGYSTFMLLGAIVGYAQWSKTSKETHESLVH